MTPAPPGKHHIWHAQARRFALAVVPLLHRHPSLRITSSADRRRRPRLNCNCGALDHKPRTRIETGRHWAEGTLGKLKMDWGNVTAGELMDALREVRAGRMCVRVCVRVSVLERPRPRVNPPVLLRCQNLTAKLSRWSLVSWSSCALFSPPSPANNSLQYWRTAG